MQPKTKRNNLDFDNTGLNYLCGNTPFCHHEMQKLMNTDPEHQHLGNKQARDYAIRNVRENYIFVGILEQFEEVLELLEYIFPSAFAVEGKASLREIYEENAEAIKSKFATVEKPETEEWVKDILREVYRYEIEVYWFLGVGEFYILFSGTRQASSLSYYPCNAFCIALFTLLSKIMSECCHKQQTSLSAMSVLQFL